MREDCSMMTLAYPLTTEQVACAQAIHSRLDRWRRADDALCALARQFPRFDETSTLLKVVTINSLYGTNLYAVMRMSEHIQRIMEETHIPTAALSLVDRIADLPSERANERRYHHAVFASKFAHFFIDGNKFPILDRYAEKMLKKHLGRCDLFRMGLSRYMTFAHGVVRLEKLSRLTCNFRELDHYLWIAGNYLAWRRNRRIQMNGELRKFFRSPPPQNEADLKHLLPSSMT